MKITRRRSAGDVRHVCPANTLLYYDGASRLRLAEIRDGKARYVEYVTDELGQVVFRQQLFSISGQTGGPREVSYRFGGRQLGFTGNDGTTDMAMATSITDRQVLTPPNQGTFRNKQVTGGEYADFAQSYDPFNSYKQGSVGGGYMVQAGDTLQGIAFRSSGAPMASANIGNIRSRRVSFAAPQKPR